MAYDYTEIQVPEIEYDLESNRASATRVIRITPWESVDEAIADLGGGAVATGNILLVTQPAKFPGKAHLWLHKIKVKPFFECVGSSDLNGLPTDPAGAELTLSYNTPAFDTSDDDRPDMPEVPVDTYLTIDRQMSVEFAAEDTQGLWWDYQYVSEGTPSEFDNVALQKGLPLPIDANVGVHIAIADIRLTWHRVKNPPRRAIQALQGMVNEGVFMDYSAEQVLFVGCSESKTFQTDGTSSYQLTYQFSARVPKFKHISFSERLGAYLPAQVVCGGWNHFPRKKTSGYDTSPFWQKVYRRAGDSSDPQTSADLLYIPGNFNLLFQPDPDSN